MCPVTWLKLLRILLALENTMFRADNNIKLLLECFNLLVSDFVVKILNPMKRILQN